VKPGRTRWLPMATLAALTCFLAGAALSQPVARGACPDVVEPVCGRKAGHNETYTNSCLARAAKARIIAQGRCPESCSVIYAPVCGLADGIRFRTYPNACEAVMAGARVIRHKRCLFDR
jgi:hypothetical protein